MWFAHVTVANVVYKNGKFLMVKEYSDGKLVFNQPAGHVEEHESIVQAVVRETLEETGWHVTPKHALGISQYYAPNNATYFRHSFVSDADAFDKSYRIDDDIEDVVWMTLDQLHAEQESMRSPMVLSDVNRFLHGTLFAIDELYVPDRNQARTP